MTIWLIRAGAHGEYEQKFLNENRVYVTWGEPLGDLSKMSDRSQLLESMANAYPDAGDGRLKNWTSQVWPFAHSIEKGDLVILPLKTQPSICVGEITGDYQYEENGPSPYFHWRSVKWINESVPRSHFGQDLLYSFGAFMTICRIQRNNAKERILAMKDNHWKQESLSQITHSTLSESQNDESSTDESVDTDLEDLGNDQIARLIEARFKGHALTRLVQAILDAQGYTTYMSPEGADGGADILAGSGPLGFGTPRLCIEVKSGDAPADRPAVDKLLGAVSKFGANEGLFVSWNGFKNNVYKEMAPSFFRIRLWTRKELLEALFTNYEKLDDDIKAALPLKRIWTVTSDDR